MGTQAAALSSFSLSPLSSYTFLSSSSSQSVSFKPLLLQLKHVNSAKSLKARTRAILDEKDKNSMLVKRAEAKPSMEVEDCVKVLKNAAKTRKVPAEEILWAFSVIEKAKFDPSGFLETLGGSESLGRTWMLIFTAQEFDSTYSPAWHCIVGLADSYVRHSLGGFLYFSIDNVYILFSKTAVEYIRDAFNRQVRLRM